MKKVLALLLVLVSLVALTGCDLGGLLQTEIITPAIDIKGEWVVVSTPETVTLSNHADYQDTAKLFDMTVRANINAIFPENGDIEIFSNGVSSCNGISMDYKYVDEDAIEFSAQGTGLIFKISETDGNLVLKLNDKYEVILQEK